MPSRRDLLRCAVVGVAVATALGAGALAWSSTLLGEYSVMDMGGGHSGDGEHGHAGHAHHGASGRRAPRHPEPIGRPATVSVTSLTADPDRRADVRVELVARQQTIDVPGGRARRGLHAERHLARARDPRAAGRPRRGRRSSTSRSPTARRCTGTASTCRTRPTASRASRRTPCRSAAGTSTASRRRTPERTGTTRTRCRTSRSCAGCSARSSSSPPTPPARSPPTRDVTALLHVYGGQHTLNGRVEDARVDAEPGSTVRVRVINTDQGTAAVWSAAPFRVARDRRARGERADRRRGAARAHPGRRASGCRGAGAAAREPCACTSAAPAASSIGDPGASAPDRTAAVGDARPARLRRPGAARTSTRRRPTASFDYVIARRFGLIDGRPGNFWTINGRLFPDVPMFHVREGDVVVMRIVNDSGEVHPMHLHGHHVVVLSRDGVAASRQPVGRRLARRASRRDVRDRVRRRQPRHLERPLPHAPPRGRRARSRTSCTRASRPRSRSTATRATGPSEEGRESVSCLRRVVVPTTIMR